MPSDVVGLCLSYYYASPECFAVTPPSIIASHNDLCIGRQSVRGSARWHNTSFGKIKVRANGNGCVYRWKFQMVRARNGSFIGITASNHANTAFIGHHGHCGYRTFNGEVVCNKEYALYGDPLLTKDVLTMTMHSDSNGMRLRFQRNQKEPGPWILLGVGAEEKQYRMAVSICCDDEVLLLDFQRKILPK